jgi:toxin ParE1/3/4
MPSDVLMSDDAERDLEELYRYLAAKESIETAERVFAAIAESCAALADFPERGHFPKELLPLGIREYREIHFKPYRIVYRIAGNRVVIYCVLDGRRDMQRLLHERLVRP